MFCKYCGRQITDDSKFCEFCGNMIQRSEAEVTEREPDIPASIGEPIFKEVVFEEESASVPEPEPVEDATRRVEIPEVQPIAQKAPEPEKKKVNKGLLWGLICGGTALLVGLIILLVVLLGKKTVSIDVTQYVDFKVSGYDGYGIAICEMDWDGLEVAAFGEYPSGSDAKSRAEQLKYKEKVAVLKGAVTLKFEKVENVKVGDKLTATFTINDAALKELDLDVGTKRTAEYTVKSKDLSGSSEIDLIGEFIDIRFEGVSGKGTATLIPKERESEYVVMTATGTEYTVTVEFPNNTGLDVKFLNSADKSTETVHIDCALSKDKELVVDEKITLHFGVDTDKALMEYGLLISKVEAEFAVTGLESFVDAFEQIEKKTFDGWKKTYVATLEKVVTQNWGYYFHGGNDIRPTVQTFEDITHKQSVLILGEEKSELYLIYSAAVTDDAILMDNFGLPRTYYFAVRLSDLYIDGEGKFIVDRVLLPKEGTDDIIGGYLDYDELMQLLTEDTEFVLENK